MKKILYLILLLNCSISLGNNEVEQFFYYIKSSDYSKALKIIQETGQSSLKSQLENYYNSIYRNELKKSQGIIVLEGNTLEYNLSLINEGLREYLGKGNEIKAIKILKESISLAKKRNDNILVAESIKLILEIYQRFSSIIEDFSYEVILNEYKDYLYDNFELKNYIFKSLKLKYRSHRNNDSLVKNFLGKWKTELENIDDKFLRAKTKIELSTIISNIDKNYLISEQLLSEAASDIRKLEQGVFEKERLISARINLSIIYFKQKKYVEALSILEKTIINNKNYLNTLIVNYKLYWLYRIHEKLGNENISKDYHLKYLELELLNDQSSKIQLVSEYQTSETEKQRLVEKAAKEKSQKTNIILGITLGLSSIIALLLYRSTKRKQRIAEQEKELEIQKTTQILKEKEVETINAMVEGQEKERLRLAGELHDNLGSTLATVKMQVENLERNLEKVEDPKTLLSKTNTLINEAYQKVRRISHERHSGVMAKEGLLPAVQKLAKQISSSGKLQIEVQDFGLENRLSNHLEITIFRIIQELTTNIVKHANATEASISLTQHDNELNIIVEDNGKGFKVGKLETKNGMGLGSIERRVEHMEGSMEVDSTIGKGTNIIIDIPIQPIATELEE